MSRSSGGVTALRIVSVGEVLWDVIGDREHLGGAPLNFAAHASRLGHSVLFLSAVGRDARGQAVLARLCELGLSARLVKRVDAYPTGIASVTLSADGQPRFVIQRPAAYDAAWLDENEELFLASWKPDWICFGTLHQTDPRARRLLRQAFAAHPAARRFYDINLRKDCYTPALVTELLAEATVIKLNEEEVREVAGILGLPSRPLGNFCRACAARFGYEAVCVTRAAQGSAILAQDEFVESPGIPVRVVDAVGAGDAFAAAFLHGYSSGWPLSETGRFANRLAAVVASRPGAVPEWLPEECLP